MTHTLVSLTIQLDRLYSNRFCKKAQQYDSYQEQLRERPNEAAATPRQREGAKSGRLTER